MTWKNLTADIEAEFVGLTPQFGDILPLEHIANPPASYMPEQPFFALTGLHITGPDMQIGQPYRPRSQAEKINNRASWVKSETARIRDAILRGERPKCVTNPKSRGRKPTMWFAVAKELGIDLYAPIAPAEVLNATT